MSASLRRRAIWSEYPGAAETVATRRCTPCAVRSVSPSDSWLRAASSACWVIGRRAFVKACLRTIRPSARTTW